MKENMEEQRVKRQRKKSYSIAKNNSITGHTFMTPAEKSKFWTTATISSPLYLPPLYPQTSNFDLSTPHCWKSLNWHSKLPHPGQFRNFSR